MMKKAWINFAVDGAMFVGMVLIALMGLVMEYVLPPGSGGCDHSGLGRGGQALFGLTRHEWGDVHFKIAVVLIALLAVHIVLHWTWIKCRFQALRPGSKDGGGCEADGPGD
jgi:hypothetical protein